MVMTNQMDFLDLIFGEKQPGTVSNAGELNVYVPSHRELDQQLNIDDIFDNTDLTLAPNFLEDAFLADDTCVPSEEVVMDSHEYQETPSTSGSQQLEQLVFQFPPSTDDGGNFQSLLLSDDFFQETTEVPPTSPSTPLSPSSSSSYTESLPPPTPDTASSMDSVSSHIPIFLRHGLKSRIMERRKKQGKGEIKVEFTPPPPEQLTPEEEERRKEKRERNKMAAQKCRSKKRAVADVLEAETKKLAKEQSKYKLEIEQLKEERDHLMDILNIHGAVCPSLKAKLRTS